MSLVTESISMELTSLLRCDECLNVFASHFFERCLTCRRTVCCACSFKDRACDCTPRSFETISTKCTYRLKHNCNSKYQRPQEGGSPEESVEFFLQKLINEKLHPVESNLVFLKVCNLVHENPEIYMPFKRIVKEVRGLNSTLVANLSMITNERPKKLQILGEVEAFFDLAEKVSTMKKTDFNWTLLIDVLRCVGLFLVSGVLIFQCVRNDGY